VAIVEALTEEEQYLYVLLQDSAGIDICEFALLDEEREDGCWRAWPFQWPWWRSEAPLQLDQSARSIGKSQSIAARAIAFPFVHPGQEMLITAPEKVHLDAITNKIETEIIKTRLLREMLQGKGGRTSFKHQPFMCNFDNGARIMGRIPQRDGRGVKGMHPLWLEQDEASDYPEPGWTELVETLKRGHEGAVWRAHGVTRGVRDSFYKFSQPGSGWRVHRITSMHRPTWSDEERQEKIKQYGSKDAPDYRRNILGEHGDASSPMFVLHRLMACVDSDEYSDYNQDIYRSVRITGEMLERDPISILLDLDSAHRGKTWLTHWIGADIGWTQAPTEILVFGEMKPNKTKPSLLQLLYRLNLTRVGGPDQVRAMQEIIRFFNPKAFALDKTGAGLPLFQQLQEDPQLAKVVKGYNFKEKVLVDFDKSIDVDPYTGDAVKDAGIKRQVLEYSTDMIRQYVDEQRLLLPWDRNLIGQFQGGSIQAVKAGMDEYGRRRISSSAEDHALDASRMAVLAHALWTIEELMKTKRQEPVIDTFMQY
jgi:hypothetical protein